STTQTARRALATTISRRRRNRRSPAHSFAYPTKKCVQFAAQAQQQTSQIHPGEQHHNGCEREIRRVVAIISYYVELKKFCRHDPAGRKENRARQRLTDRQVIFRRQEIKRERENDQGHSGEWHA